MADKGIANNTDTRLASFRNLAQTPVAKQLMLMAGIAAAVAIGVAIVMWSRSPDYGLLYAGLEQKDAAAVTQALQTANTPYKLGTDGGSVFVPAADVAGIRLKLAGQGLPQGTAASAVSTQGDSPFGMSDMAERSRYQQLLENDLGSTIAGLQSVKGARVHLALPKPSAFIRDNHPASASVVVALYPGRQLDAGQVSAIVHLVSSSVPGLDAREVSVIDQQGQLLTANDPDSPGAIGDARMRLSNQIEGTYAARVEGLLTPLVGAGKVRAQVFANLDFSNTEKASETFNHENPALRSEQTSSDTRHDGAASGGIPGALSNQPPNAAPQPTAAKPDAGGKKTAVASTQSSDPSQSTTSATRNYELDRTVSHVVEPAGNVSRLTVAVVVDNKQIAGKDGKMASVPFTADEIERMTTLTKNAVGFDAKRGDSVSVINEPFHISAEDINVDVPFWQQPGVMDMIKQGVGVLAALLVAFFVLRPMMRTVMRPPMSMQPALSGPIPTVSVIIDDDDDAATQQLENRNGGKGVPALLAYEQKIGLAKRMATDNPKQVAQVVRSWVSEDG
jgi:flagellar M-ring protein FliF